MSSISIIGTGTSAARSARWRWRRRHRRGHRPQSSKAADLAKDLRQQRHDGRAMPPSQRHRRRGPALRHVVPFVTQYGDALGGQGHRRHHNPFNATADRLAIPDDTPIAQNCQGRPGRASVVKAFNAVFGHVLAEGRTLDVFIAGDDARAKAGVASSSRVWAAPDGRRRLQHGELAGRNHLVMIVLPARTMGSPTSPSAADHGDHRHD